MLAKFARLTPHDRRLLVETVLLVVTTWAAFRVRRQSALTRLRTSAHAAPGATASSETEARVRWALAAVAHRLPLARNCLVQAMVARELLRRQGCASRVVVGVARGEDGRLSAHAWLEGASRSPVVGGEEAAVFTPLGGAHVEAS